MKKKFLDLGLQPLANKYYKKTKKLTVKKKELYRLEVLFDEKTKLVSLKKKIPVEKMFDNNYPYRSSMSITMNNSFKKLSKKILTNFSPKKILEIGSNDGALIKNFNSEKVICVEPCGNLAKITKKKGYTTYSKYWNFNLSKIIKKKFNSVDLIYSSNTITHIKNLDDVFSSITNILSAKGILIIEDPSLLECIRKTSYDQFYNEHIYVFSTLSLKNILKKHNLTLFDIEKLPTHGGSLRYYIKRNLNSKLKIKNSVKKQITEEKKFNLHKFTTYLKFGLKIKQSRNQLRNILFKIKSRGYKIIGYGATAKATTVLNYCKINHKIIDMFLDTTPEKANRYMPGTDIKIIKYNKKLLLNIKYIFLGAWNFKDEIFKKEKKFIKKGGKFITHVPIPKIFS